MTSKSGDIDSITRDKFMEYLTKRKTLDKEYGKVVLQQYSQHQAKYEVQKEKQREAYNRRIAEDEDFREKMTEKSRRQYQKKKQGTTSESEGVKQEVPKDEVKRVEPTETEPLLPKRQLPSKKFTKLAGFN